MVAKSTKSVNGMTAEEVEVRDEALRLRGLANTVTICSSPPPSTKKMIPAALQGFHGADIVKKNTQKRIKYLMFFPGAISVPNGGRVGQIEDLNTPTPRLVIDYITFKITFLGAFVHPKNTILSLKPSLGRKKSVLIQDVFQSVIAFTEWTTDNKAEMEKFVETSESLWKTPDQPSPSASEDRDAELAETVFHGDQNPRLITDFFSKENAGEKPADDIEEHNEVQEAKSASVRRSSRARKEKTYVDGGNEVEDVDSDENIEKA